MLNDHEQFELLQVLNQARQALGKQVDLDNSLAMSSDLGEFGRLAVQFPELDFENFRRAISEALLQARRTLSEGNLKLWDLNINPIPEVRSQLNTIQKALNAMKIDTTPKLAAPKAEPETITAEQLPARLELSWKNYNLFEKVKGFLPRLWDPEWFTKETWEAVKGAILSDADKAGHLEVIRQAGHNTFSQRLAEATKLAGTEIALKGMRVLTLQDADEIQGAIDYTNLGLKDKPVVFDAVAEFKDAVGLATVEQYCLIVHGRPDETPAEKEERTNAKRMREKFAAPEPTKPTTATAASPMITNLDQLEEINP